MAPTACPLRGAALRAPSPAIPRCLRPGALSTAAARPAACGALCTRPTGEAFRATRAQTAKRAPPPIALALRRPPPARTAAAAAVEAPASAAGRSGAAGGGGGSPTVRNVAIIAHVDHGKTTLVDGLLVQARLAEARAGRAGGGRGGAGPDGSTADESDAAAGTGALPPSASLRPRSSMDSGALERERGITILAKATSLEWKGHKVNVIDTPGHADFGGEVERALGMADAALLVVDAAEGPMPQTRAVLSRALARRMRVVVVINKVDRAGADAARAADAVLDLFLELGADDELADFAIVYVCAARRVASLDGADEVLRVVREQDEELARRREARGGAGAAAAQQTFAPSAPGASSAAAATDVFPPLLEPVLESLLEHVPPAEGDAEGAPRLQVAALDADPHLGRLAMGKVDRGVLERGQALVLVHPLREGSGSGDGTGEEDAAGGSERDGAGSPDVPVPFRVTALWTFARGEKVPADRVAAGDLAVVAGAPEVHLGDALCCPSAPEPLPAVPVDPPTVRLALKASDSPLAGKSGTRLTPGAIESRLASQALSDPALKVAKLSADEFEVAGRGALHLSILLETMRREGFEFEVGAPRVAERVDPETGVVLEPVEEAWIEAPEESMGAVSTLMGERRAELIDLSPVGTAGAPGADARDASSASASSSSPPATAHKSSPSGTTLRATYRLPTALTLGLRGALATATRGRAVLASAVVDWQPSSRGGGDAEGGPKAKPGGRGGKGAGRSGDGGSASAAGTSSGAIIALSDGKATAFALEGAQQRGRLYVRPGDDIYPGMIVGVSSRPADVLVNVCRKKRLTNQRAAAKDQTVILHEPLLLDLEGALDAVREDELVEVTPDVVRIRKKRFTP